MIHDDHAKIKHIKAAVKDHKEEVVDVKVQEIEIEIVHHHQMIQHKKDDVVVNKNEEMKAMIQV